MVRQRLETGYGDMMAAFWRLDLVIDGCVDDIEMILSAFQKLRESIWDQITLATASVGVPGHVYIAGIERHSECDQANVFVRATGNRAK